MWGEGGLTLAFHPFLRICSYSSVYSDGESKILYMAVAASAPPKQQQQQQQQVTKRAWEISILTGMVGKGGEREPLY
eukprot:scaffold22639_cov105-Cylindrotheca_fusiformis.AAC.11